MGHGTYLPAFVIIISVPNSKKRCHNSLICSSTLVSSLSWFSVASTLLCMACIESKASVERSKDDQKAKDY